MIIGAVLVTLAGWMLLVRLGDEPFAMWDEARLAVNALEMHDTGDPIVTRYGGAPDLWNTKPPFVIWCQAALLGVVDDPELAVRLPSAIATLGTLLVVFVLLLRETGEPWPGLAAALVLLGTPAFIGYHAGRSGDYDSMLVLWTTLYCAAWFRYCSERSGAALATFAAGLALAMLTKGIAALLVAPGLLVFTLLDRRLGDTLRDGRAWLAVAIALAVGLGWYAIREWTAPGYIAAVLVNEVGSFSAATDGTQAGSLFLLKGILDSRFVPWIYLLAPAALIAWWASRRLALWAICLLVGFFAVIENSSTRLSWYDLPAYPFAAIVLGIAIVALIRYGMRALAPGRAWLMPAAVAAVFALPLARSELKVLAIDRQSDSRLDYGEALDRLNSGPVTIIDSGYPNTGGLRDYNAVLTFEAERARERGIGVRILHPGEALSAGLRFLTCDPQVLSWARLRFIVGATTKNGPCTFASLLAPRPAITVATKKAPRSLPP